MPQCSVMKLNTVFWNTRRMENPLSTGYLRQLLSKHFIHFCVILEPVVDASHQIRKFASFCGSNNWLENQSIGGNIWVLWWENVHIEHFLLTDK